MREDIIIREIKANTLAYESNGCEVALEKSFVYLEQLRYIKGFEDITETLDYLDNKY